MKPDTYHKIGYWKMDANGLPGFVYTGVIPYKEKVPDGKTVKLPEDPWFLLGNYRITLFTHISGEYELISGQRSWGRLNQGKVINSGTNSSVITIDGEDTVLTGLESIAKDSEKCQRSFGCGLAEYTYDIGGTQIERRLAVKPSFNPYDGASAFLLTVTIKNNGDTTKKYTYKELLGVNYREIQYQALPEEQLMARCVYEPFSEGNIAGVKISTKTDEPMKPSREEMSRFEFYPPSPFMCDSFDCGKVSSGKEAIESVFTFELKPLEEKQVQLIIGFAMSAEIEEIRQIVDELVSEKDNFNDEWLAVLPRFENEADAELRRELIWHAYCLEAMATYSEYYKETKIPQGTIYDYCWGQHASARDNFQHALPLVYYNPKLAKSVLRYLLKRTTPFGEIRLIEFGNGFAYNDRYFTSDQQLYYFILLTEYLKTTGDYAFLEEKITPYPVEDMKEKTVLELSKACFVFLRDTIGRGEHGLIKLLNSDWWDSIYYMEKTQYNVVFSTGESHMNSAMALCTFDKLIRELKCAGEYIPEKKQTLDLLCSSIGAYRENLLSAFMRDMGERSFSRRMYFAGKPYGEGNMFLEPQGFTLQIEELSEDRKRALYKEMKKRVYKGELIGARQQEAPEFTDNPEWDAGSRDNGGFWYSLNGPVILGVSSFDREEAWRLLKQMTFHNLSEKFPDYWSSYWSAADTLESSMIPEQGLPDQTDSYWCMPVFCAHPHAWILYCYYKLINQDNQNFK